MKLIATDNCRDFVINDQQAVDDLRHIADCPLDKLTDKDCNDVWVFPSKESRYDDKIEDETILSLYGNKMFTGNIMGFIGYGDTELTIRSRFSSRNNGHDWFMQYMLQKVFAINIFKLQSSLTTEGILDIAAMLFPYFLQKALCQGIYREYIRCSYNDSRVRGAIDFSAHIKNNFPFKNGKISYTTREYKYDNSVTQLIRHTIEYLRSKDFAKQILFSSQEMQGFIKQIVEATPTYCKADRNKVMLANLKPKIHPYYSEYRPLQKLCLQKSYLLELRKKIRESLQTTGIEVQSVEVNIKGEKIQAEITVKEEPAPEQKGRIADELREECGLEEDGYTIQTAEHETGTMDRAASVGTSSGSSSNAGIR